MGQQDTRRIQHDVGEQPTTFRSFDLESILNDVSEEMSGQGFTEVIRSGVFVDKIIVWESSSKTVKRTETVFTRNNPPFISSVEKKFFDRDGNQTSSVTSVITRDGNNLMTDVDVSVTRP